MNSVPGNTWLVVGLGNPGPGYASHRHNVGQMVVDELASRIGATFKKHKTPAQVAEGFLRPGGPKLVLAKSNSYMNTSGGPVAALLQVLFVAAGAPHRRPRRTRHPVRHRQAQGRRRSRWAQRAARHRQGRGLAGVRARARRRRTPARPPGSAPTSCSRASPRPSVPCCRICSPMRRMPSSSSSPTDSSPRSRRCTPPPPEPARPLRQR